MGKRKRPTAIPKIIPYSPDLSRFHWVTPTLVQPKDVPQPEKGPRLAGEAFLRAWAEEEREAVKEERKRARGQKDPPYLPRGKGTRIPVRGDTPRDVHISEIKAWIEAEEAEGGRNKDGSFDAMAFYPSLEMAQLAAGTVPGENVKIAFRIVTADSFKKTIKGIIIDLSESPVDGDGFVDTSPYVYPSQVAKALSSLSLSGLNQDYPVALLVFWAPIH